MRVALLCLFVAGCGASVEPTEQPGLTPAESTILGCLVELEPTARAASCSFVAEPGQAYWAEVSGPVLAGTSAELCAGERCSRVTSLHVEAGLGARVDLPVVTERTAWSVRFVSNP